MDTRYKKGTPQISPIEQAFYEGSEDISQVYESSQADVFSLGVILFALVLKTLPFHRQEN